MRNGGVYSLCLAGVAMLSIAGCDLREPTVTPPADVEPSQPGPGAMLGKVPVEQMKRQGELAALLDGLNAIQPKLEETKQAYLPIEPLGDHRLLLHPGVGKRAQLVVDVSSLTSVNLSPVIESFQGNTTCEADPSAGVAGLHWRLDQGSFSDVVVDRHYTSAIKIDVAGAKQLVIESSDQNGVIWCDWLAVGFTDVAPK
jgi:predicted small lipoprotein YifL